MSTYDIDVERTLRKIPRDGVKNIITICDMGEGEVVKVFTTLDDERDVAAIIWEAYEMYDPEIEVDMEGNDNSGDI